MAETTDAEVDAAVQAAAAALAEWAGLGGQERARALEAVADALDARAGELVPLADEETALGETRLTGEVARTTGQLRLFAGVLRDGGYADAVASAPGGGIAEIRRVSHPVGPVAVFAASNFPFAFSVAGGTPPPRSPPGARSWSRRTRGTRDLGADRADRHRGPRPGRCAGRVFGLVHGFEAGVRLLTHPAVSAAGFTGSTCAGLELARICAERKVPIPFYGELGAVNPVVVLPGAAASHGEQIASGYAGSLTLGAGQFCTNPGLLFVPAGESALSAAVTDAVGAASGAPMLSERIWQGYEASLAEVEAHPAVTAVAAGTGGEGPWAATPRLFSTTLAEFAADIPVLSRERFGPWPDDHLPVRRGPAAGAGHARR